MKPPVEVDADLAVVQLGTVEILHRALRVGSIVILHEAETAGGEEVLVQTHDDGAHNPDFAEELPDLLLGGVEGHVTDVQRRGGAKALEIVLEAALELAVLILGQRLLV